MHDTEVHPTMGTPARARGRQSRDSSPASPRSVARPEPISPTTEVAELPQMGVQDFKKLAQAMSGTLGSFGELLISMGNVERVTGTSFQDLGQRFADPQFLSALVTTLPPEQLGLFVKVMVRLASLGTINLNKMTPEQKLAVGASMKEASAELDRLFVALEKLTTTSVHPAA